jgi:hypothetical protein
MEENSIKVWDEFRLMRFLNTESVVKFVEEILKRK